MQITYENLSINEKRVFLSNICAKNKIPLKDSILLFLVSNNSEFLHGFGWE